MLVKYSDARHAAPRSPRSPPTPFCLFSKQPSNGGQLFPLIVNPYGKQRRQTRDGCAVNPVRCDCKQRGRAPFRFPPRVFPRIVPLRRRLLPPKGGKTPPFRPLVRAFPHCDASNDANFRPFAFANFSRRSLLSTTKIN